MVELVFLRDNWQTVRTLVHGTLPVLQHGEASATALFNAAVIRVHFFLFCRQSPHLVQRSFEPDLSERLPPSTTYKRPDG